MATATKSSKKKATRSKKKTSKRQVKSSSKKKATKKRAAAASSKKASSKKASKKATQKAAKKAAGKRTSKKTGTKKATKKRTSGKKASKAKASSKKKASKQKTSRSRVAKKTTSKAKSAPKKSSKAKAQEASPEISKEVLEALNIPTVEEAMANLRYQEGQFIVHPKYGLGMVDRIVDRKLSTRVVPCLEISFGHQEMKLTIPVDQVDRSGLRQPISKKDIDEVFKVLRGRATFDAKRRSAKRVADYRKRLNEGDPTSLAEAVRDLGRLSLKKSLSYEERKLLSMAMRILTREVALARGREPDSVREEIEAIVYR